LGTLQGRNTVHSRNPLTDLMQTAAYLLYATAYKIPSYLIQQPVLR
jgi:hypothetical protein